MSNVDQLALWSAAATLRAGGEEVAALTVDDIASQVQDDGDLVGALEAMGRFDRRPGDFGAEIIGPLLIPVIIEAGKQLWSAYVKRLSEEGGRRLADLTLQGLKGLASRAWKEDPALAKDYARLIDEEARRQGLANEQVSRLVAIVAQPRMQSELAPG